MNEIEIAKNLNFDNLKKGSFEMKRISIAEPVFNGNEKKYLMECIDTGWVSANGRFVTEFQNKFAEYNGSKYAIACANGTVTLQLIIKAMHIGPGDEVIMPTLTYVATANAVVNSGATPVFVDVDPNTWNVDPEAVEMAITHNTRAIIPVHLYGLACNMSALMDISNRYGIPIIEDTAEAHGAKWEGKKVGSIGKVGSFSFFGNKIITCGEGGMILTNDDDLYKSLTMLRSQGVDPHKRYWHIIRGYNYRMTNMQAAVGLGQLENINWHINERKRVAKIYKKLISEKLGDYVKMQKVDNEENHVYWMTCITLNENVKKERDEIMAEMEEKNIEMRPMFYPMHIMPVYRDNSLKLPVAEKLAKTGICLPSHSKLNEETLAYIIDSLAKIIKG